MRWTPYIYHNVITYIFVLFGAFSHISVNGISVNGVSSPGHMMFRKPFCLDISFFLFKPPTLSSSLVIYISPQSLVCVYTQYPHLMPRAWFPDHLTLWPSQLAPAGSCTHLLPWRRFSADRICVMNLVAVVYSSEFFKVFQPQAYFPCPCAYVPPYCRPRWDELTWPRFVPSRPAPFCIFMCDRRPNIRNVYKVVYKIFGCRLGHFLGILFKSIMIDFIFMYGEQASA